tara:strand:+ start:120 stop:1973 length:1854 start_codon:yes stop_codon:yes gene_type:complete
MLFQINPSFTKKNQLKLDLSKNILDKNFKLCFSLIYTIQSVDGAKIIKQIGRYYELEIQKNIILINLQTPKIGNYNKSCGPEGVFLIDKNNEHKEIKINNLLFDYVIEKPNYDQSVVNNFIPIIPEPSNYLLKNGVTKIDNKFKLINGEDIINNTRKLILKINIIFSKNEGFPILFLEKDLDDDEYVLEILNNKILIYYKNYGGKLYAIMTLIQMFYYYKNKIPLCIISDKPNYIWRGMHLDCARQFYSIEEIKRLLDYMALFKMNRFHWHLTDNEAWRIEIKKYPKLTQFGSYRGYHSKIPPFYGSGFKEYGGFYSQEEVRYLISYAKKLNIEIMPEIDLPAHSWALLQIMPELKDQKSNIVSEDIGSYKNNTINPSIDETKLFLQNMFGEICDIFTFDIIHVGLDERPKNSWEFSPSINEFMKKNKIKSQAEFQDYYMNYLINIMKLKNKRTGAWNEAAVSPHIDHGVGGSAGNIDKSCLVFSWEHSDVARETTNNNFETILCPGEKTYFDMAHNNSTEERGLCWASTIEVRDIFSWKPDQNIKNKNLVKGVQAQLWSETITKKKYFDQMINPRLATLAEIAWKGRSTRSWVSFRSCLLNTCKMLNNFGWTHHLF